MSTTDPTNHDRCRWATIGLDAFARSTHITGEGIDIKVADLLTDLHHLCDAHGVSFEACLDGADIHYHAELADEADNDNDPVLIVALEYADLFNSVALDDVDRLIADACVDPFWDDRTNLLSLLADEPTQLGLVLSDNGQHRAVVRWIDGYWIADGAPVDWDALEDRAFASSDESGT